MGKADMILAQRDGGIQFLRENQKASVNRIRLRNEGVPLFPVQKMADVIPDARGPVA